MSKLLIHFNDYIYSDTTDSGGRGKILTQLSQMPTEFEPGKILAFLTTAHLELVQQDQKFFTGSKEFISQSIEIQETRLS